MWSLLGTKKFTFFYFGAGFYIYYVPGCLESVWPRSVWPNKEEEKCWWEIEWLDEKNESSWRAVSSTNVRVLGLDYSGPKAKPKPGTTYPYLLHNGALRIDKVGPPMRWCSWRTPHLANLYAALVKGTMAFQLTIFSIDTECGLVYEERSWEWNMSLDEAGWISLFLTIYDRGVKTQFIQWAKYRLWCP